MHGRDVRIRHASGQDDVPAEMQGKEAVRATLERVEAELGALQPK